MAPVTRQLIRFAAAGLTAAGLLLMAPGVGPADRSVFTVSAHAGLVSSAPGGGEVLTAPPTEIRLVFAEPIDARYSSFDLFDASGTTIATAVAAVDPEDGRVLVAPISAGTLPADGIVEVRWHTLSAADGHSDRGSFDFAIGAEAGRGLGGTAGGTDPNASHTSGITVIEIPGRVLAYSGAMLAFGLAVVGLVALRPAGLEEGSTGVTAAAPPDPRQRRRSRPQPTAPAWSISRVMAGLPVVAAVGLAAGAVGCLILIAVGFASLPVPAGSADLVSFVTGTHSALLLAGRIVLGVGAAVALVLLSRRDAAGRSRVLLLLAGAAGLASLALTAAGSHAAAFVSPVPMLADLVHLGAASIWMGGLALLAGLTDFGRASRLAPGALGRIIPRFSALALVSVATIALTGVYADWLLTGELLGLRTPYQISLVAKTAVFLTALAIGAVNLFDGGRSTRWIGGLPRRLVLEYELAIGVIAIAAFLSSGSPSAFDRPVALEPTAGAVEEGAAAPPTLALLPGRPGPNRFIVNGASAADVTLVLRRLDLDTGTNRIEMREAATSGGAGLVADAPLPPSSRWDVTVVEGKGDGAGAREDFQFALDATGISEGRALPPVDPTLVVALILIGLAALGLGFSLAGGVLPRTMPDASRAAVIGSSAVAIVLGLAIIMVGAPT